MGALVSCSIATTTSAPLAVRPDVGYRHDRQRPVRAPPRGRLSLPDRGGDDETEEDLRKGHETLNTMSPSSDTVGKRVSVETYEVAVDIRI